ncbi:MAG: carboxypeptidase regulatory-like domain-containing protein [Bryobacterales bacterium]|jgi:protocatechuate 3,4-dioxygenase beta subunit|nr:carboxypeptidase regulatory-like domain-containing protein [Bryobacterales bacterium]
MFLHLHAIPRWLTWLRRPALEQLQTASLGMAAVPGMAAALCLLLVGQAIAQPSPAAGLAAQPGVIEGRVMDADTGEPIAEATVWVDTAKVGFFGGKFGVTPGQPSDGFAESGEDGAFTLRGVPPGKRSITAMAPKGIFNEARLSRQVGPGQTLGDCVVRMRNPASVRGRVVDEKGEPLAGVQIHLVVEEYHAGKVRQYLRPGGMSDENGEYQIESAVAGRAVRLMAERVARGAEASADSNAPIDPKLRRPAFSRVFYPDAPDLQGATVLKFRSGEERGGVDFVMRREPSRCIAGKLLAPTEVKGIRVMLQHAEPAYGSTRRGGSFGMTWSASLDGRREFRICQLAAGRYRLRAHDTAEGRNAAISAYAAEWITITDRDLSDLEIPMVAPWKLSTELEWAAAAPEAPPTQPTMVALEPLDRAFFMGEQRNARIEAIPGRGEMGAVLVDEYSVSVRLPRSGPSAPGSGAPTSPAPGLYVKEIRYGDAAVLAQAMRVGMQPADTALKVRLGHDAGTVTVRVTDQKRNPVSDAQVFLLPSDAADEGALAETLLRGQTDQYGSVTWQREVAPGSYRAVAILTNFDYSPEAVRILWQARDRAPEVRVAPNGNAEVGVQVVQQ